MDDIKPEVALTNAQTAMQKYPDLAGFITFYSYDGPMAGQAVQQAGKGGEIKIVAFDAEPETQRLMSEGVVQAMIGQRVYFYGYLSGYIMNAMSILGVEETMKVLDPYLSDWPTTTSGTVEGWFRGQNPPQHRCRRHPGGFVRSLQGISELHRNSVSVVPYCVR